MLDDFIKLVTRSNSLFHFTDRSNVPSIRENGLLSYDVALKRGIPIPHPGGNEWSHDADTRLGLHCYVHLSLTDNHPMLFHARKEGRIPDPVHLRFDPQILRLDGVKMSLDVSNKSGVEVLDLIQALPQVDGEILFTKMNWKDPAIGARRRAADKYEILIPEAVAVHHIRFPHGH